MSQDLPELPELSAELRAALLAHAEQESPKEACGLLVALRADGQVQYMPCRNTAAEPEQRFALHPEDYAAAEDAGQVVAVVHSHPNACANPTMADRLGCERSGLPWLVVGWPSAVMKWVQPEGWQAPYIGREFHHGVLDCYTLIQDWYWRELGIELPHFARDEGWWENDEQGNPKGDLYMQHFAEAGFVAVAGPVRLHDVPLMQVRADVANHAGVIMADGSLLHHFHSSPSCTSVYRGGYERATLRLLRHRKLLEAA